MSVHPHSLERLETRTCFAATTAVPPPPPPPITVLADINGDGKADLVTLYAEAPASTSTTITPAKPTWELKVQLGKGDGTFSAAKEFASPAQAPVSIAVGDLDGDGKADIAILNRDPVQTTTTSTTPPPVHESIFVLKTDGKGAVLPPPAGATAPKPIAMPDGFDGSSIAISDLNKDNLADLVAIGNLLPKPTTTTTTTMAPKPVVNVATLLNTATAKGTFQKPALTATDADPGFYQLARAGDLDKNGSPDLVAYQVAPPPRPPGQTSTPPSTSTTSTQPPKNLAIILSNGDGTVKAKSQANPLLPPPPTSTTTQQPPAVRTLGVSDIDGDGVADLVGASATSILVAKFDPKTMTFQAAKPAGSTNTPTNLGTSQVLLGDVNGDGKADLLALSDKGVSLGLNASKAGAPAFAWSAVKVA